MNGSGDRAHLTRAQIQLHLDGDPAGPPPGEARAHLDSCADCRRRADAYLSLFRDLDALPVPEPPAGFDARVLAAVLPRPAEASVFFRTAARVYAFASAVMAALLGGAFLIAGPAGVRQATASGLASFVGLVLGSARSFGVGCVDLLKTLGEFKAVAEAAEVLGRGLETAVGAALPPQVLLPYVLTLVLAGLVLIWALKPARERGVPHVSLSL